MEFNTYISLTSQELENLLYSSNPYKHNGVYLSQCQPISEESSDEGKYYVCFFKDITILDMVKGLLQQFQLVVDPQRERFCGYDGGDAIGGLLTYWVNTDDMKSQPCGRYTSFFDGSRPIRNNLGMFIDYMQFLLSHEIPEPEWLDDTTKNKYLVTLKDNCLYCSDKKFDFDPLIGGPDYEDVIEEALEILNRFDPMTKV